MKQKYEKAKILLDKNPEESVGARIYQIIHALRMTQEEFGREIGSAKSTINTWINEDKKADPSLSSLVLMMKRFPNLNARFLLLGELPIFMDKERERKLEEAEKTLKQLIEEWNSTNKEMLHFFKTNLK